VRNAPALLGRLEVFVLRDVVRGADQIERWMASASHARREAFTYHSSNFMILAVFAVVYDSVDAGGRDLVPWFMGFHGVESSHPFKTNQPAPRQQGRKRPGLPPEHSFGWYVPTRI